MSQTLDYTKPESGVTTFGELYQIIRDHIEAVGTCFRGTSFPTNPKEGQLCFRSDIPEHYVYYNAAWVTLDSLLTASYSLVERRALFERIANYQINIGAAGYWVKDKWAYWTSTITTNAIGSPSANTVYYLYLDYSAITSKTAITTATPFIWSTTAPTYNTTYRQWLSGDDRCIFGTLTDSTPNGIYHFLHSSNFVQYTIARRCGTTSRTSQDYDAINTSNTFDDCYLPVPGFVKEAELDLHVAYIDTATSAYYRPKGDIWGSNLFLVYVNSIGINYVGAEKRVFCNTDQVIQLKWSDACTNDMTANCNGWYFPRGM